MMNGWRLTSGVVIEEMRAKLFFTVDKKEDEFFIGLFGRDRIVYNSNTRVFLYLFLNVGSDDGRKLNNNE